ncbi:hypothetical protein [Roseateles asaccharophilus]|uniref:DUF1648 domain-containing protein n=1 Tax=Roseateles asaccharophilus TaxID=582607 RepID=A0ABU2A364_9BURK|nr:hypothetical protein [Roseateles asaccharophilus]MDR7331627.1 hypothetical protein [Roseateles asaccharophilus]
MRLVFNLAWLALLVFLVSTWPLMPDLVGAPHKALPRDQHMAVMLVVALLCPWMATYGALLLARRAPGLVNLPYRDHWLAPAHREQTLTDMGGRLAVLGLGLLALFAGLHYRELQRAQPHWPQVPPEVWTAGAVAQGLAFAVWLLALMRRFNRLPAVASPPPVRHGSRSTDLVWRESQLMWPLLAVLLPVSVGVGIALSASPARGQGLWMLAALPALLVLVFGRMVTEVHGDRLVWRFGWLPWPRWQVDLDDIVAVEPARSRWIEGWGIRFASDGMLYNASGTQAVRLALRDGRRLRLGSHEPRELIRSLQGRIAGR